MRHLLPLVLCLLLTALAPALAQDRPGRTLLTGAWTPDEAGLLTPEGLAPGPRPFDIALLDAVAQQAGIGVALVPMEGARIAEALRDGRLDFALPSARADRPEPWLRFSMAFGTRREILFLTREAAAAIGAEATAPGAALAAIARRGLRLAVVGDARGFAGALAPPVAQLAEAGRLLTTGSDAKALRLLFAGEADAVVADRLAGLAALAAQADATRFVVLPLTILEATEHIAFSAASVDAATVAAFDRAIAARLADGSAEALRVAEARPVVLRHAVASAPWIAWLDLVGTFAFAISGVLIARREGWSILGAFVLAALPAAAGGAMRDLLVDRRPIWILESPVPLTIVLVVVVAGHLLYRAYDAAHGRLPLLLDIANLYVRVRRFAPPRVLHEVSDALGLAVLTVTGVLVAVRFGAEPLWLWGPLLAVLTGAGGGILRDVVRSDPAIPGLRTSLYAEIPAFWGLLLSLVVMRFGREENLDLLVWAVVATVVGAFATRMAVVALRLPAPRF